MLGLKDINLLTHKLENVFDAARSGKLFIDTDVVELMFQSVDRLSGLVNLLKDPGSEPICCDTVIEAIQNLLQNANAERKLTTQADAEKALADAMNEHIGSSSSTSPTPSWSIARAIVKCRIIFCSSIASRLLRRSAG